MEQIMSHPIGFRIDPHTTNRLERIKKATGLKSSDLARMALIRLMNDFEESGKLEFPTQRPAQPETASA